MASGGILLLACLALLLQYAWRTLRVCGGAGPIVPYSTAPARRPFRIVLGTALLTGPYLLAVGFLRRQDVYHLHYADTGWIVLFYNLARCAVALYLVWILYSLGERFIRWARLEQALAPASSLHRFLAAFYAGSALLHVVMYVLGFANLYYFETALLLTVPVVLQSYGQFERLVVHAYRSLHGTTSRGSEYRICLLACAVLFLLGILLVTNGTYPAGSHDYWNHYGPYYRAVLENHGIWPNELWYHFIYTKGAGLYFLAMLLSDFSMATLMSVAFIAVSAGALFSLVRTATRSGLWGLTGVAVYTFAFIQEEGFEKQHVFMASLIAGFLWLLMHVKTTAGAARRGWCILATLAGINVVLFAPTAFTFMALVLTLGIGWSLVRRQAGALGPFCGVLGALMLMFGGQMILNYLIFGVAESTPFRIFFEHSDHERMARWFSPYLPAFSYETSQAGSFAVGNIRANACQLEKLFRWGSLWPFVPIAGAELFVIALGALLMFHKWEGRPDTLSPTFNGLALVAAAAALLSFLSDQRVSMERFYVFSTFLTVGLGTLMYYSGAQALSKVVPALKADWICLVPTLLAVGMMGPLACDRGAGSADFFTGRLSLEQAVNRQLIEGRSAVDAKVREVAGLHTRVWCFSDYVPSLAPGLKYETFVSFSMGRNWHEVVFQDAGKAKAALKAQGLNYFLIDFRVVQRDPLCFSELFRPEHVGEHLHVAWADENRPIFLLTWPGPDTRPLPGHFLPLYRNCLRVENTEMIDWKAIYDHMKHLYDFNGGRAYPVNHDPSRPSVKGWPVGF